MAYPSIGFNAFAAPPMNQGPPAWHNAGKNHKGIVTNFQKGSCGKNQMYSPMKGKGPARPGFAEFQSFATAIGLPQNKLNEWESDLCEQLISVLDCLPGPFPLLEWINFRICTEIESFVDPSGVTLIRRCSNAAYKRPRKRSRSRSLRVPRAGQAQTPPALASANNRQGNGPPRQAQTPPALGSRREIRAAAEEGDPVYEMETEELEPWPQTENSDGTYTDAHYKDFSMHFCYPDNPMKEVHEADFRRVADYLCRRHGFEYDKIKETTDGVVQMNFPFKKGGCIQLYTTK